MTNSPKRSRSDGYGSTRKISPDDVVTALVLALSLLCALLLPQSAWPRLSRYLGRLHCRLKPPNLAATVATLKEAGLTVSATDLRQGILAGTYLENIEAMSEYFGFRRTAGIEIKGLENVRRALAQKRGVILWCPPLCGSQAISLRAFSQARLPVTRLQSIGHPFSVTQFGLRVLNRLRTRIERRHLTGAVLLSAESRQAALVDLMRILRRNELVLVTAIGSGKDPFRIPFLGGTLTLARGVPKIAAAIRAPVIPVWFSIAEAPRYVIEFEPALEMEDHHGDKERDRLIAVAFAHRLARRLRCEPGSWRGWIMNHTWSPVRQN